MWKYGNKTIEPGKGWIDDNGVRHPSNWQIWSTEEKARHNIKEISEDIPPDYRLYTWSTDNDGKITSTAKALDDSGSGKNKVLGVKSTLKEVIKAEQGHLLFQKYHYP